MCAVEVLLVARTTTFGFGDSLSNRGGVCRRLFADEAPADRPPISALAALRVAEAELYEKQKGRWNFDFKTETPLPGRYMWTSTTAPTIKHKAQTQEISNMTTVIEKMPTVIEKRPTSNTTNSTKQQSKITDYLFHRKRPRGTETTNTKLKLRRLDIDISATGHQQMPSSIAH